MVHDMHAFSRVALRLVRTSNVVVVNSRAFCETPDGVLHTIMKLPLFPDGSVVEGAGTWAMAAIAEDPLGMPHFLGYLSDALVPHPASPHYL